MIAAETFRADLYYRINGIAIRLPPLRERAHEVEGLARSFLAASCARAKRQEPALAGEALAVLRAHAWPGNLRELRNVMDRVAILAKGEVTAAVLATSGIERASAPPAAPRAEERPSSAAPIAPSALDTIPPPNAALRSEIDTFERERIVRALEQAGGSRKRAAEIVGMPLRTFVKRLTRYGLTRKRSATS
jgi:DNA-binding NtrC family response regulator